MHRQPSYYIVNWITPQFTAGKKSRKMLKPSTMQVATFEIGQQQNKPTAKIYLLKLPTDQTVFV